MALVREACRRFALVNPNPRCELYYRTDFQLLLSVMLSAQTTDKMVNASMREVYDQGFGPDEVLSLGVTGMHQLIRRIGLAPTKAKNAVLIARCIKGEHVGKVPMDRESLEALPGVGRKTASVVLAELFGAKTLAVDTHVYRVSRRLGMHAAKTAEACEVALLKLFPKELLPKAHHWLILHGRYTCKAIKPDCAHCLLADLCPSLD